MTANAQLHGNGTRTAGIQLGATWRERKVPVAILGAIRDDVEHTIAPHLAVKVGGVTIAAANLSLVKALPGKCRIRRHDRGRRPARSGRGADASDRSSR